MCGGVRSGVDAREDNRRNSEGNDMETRTNKSPPTLHWIAGIAVTLFSAVGIAAIMGWIPSSSSSPAESVVLANPTAPAKPAVARAHATPAHVPVQVASNTPAKV